MPFTFNPISSQFDYYQSSTGSIDVTSTNVIANNSVVRGDGGVRGVQDSLLFISDTGVVTGATQVNVDNLRFDGNTISSTDVNGNINLTPNGIGVIAGTELTLTTDLAVSHGGTGASSLTDGGILLGSGTGAITVTSQPTNGQVLVGSTGVDPVLSTLTAGTGITVTNGAGSITIDAINNGTVTSVSGTANRITSTGGATPVIDIDANYIGQASITTLGTITTGVWNGTDIEVADGGTGRGTATAYAVLCGGTTATGAHQSIASVGTSGQVLKSNGAGALPTFQDAAAGGAWTYITQASASGSASISFTNLNSTYIMYRVVATEVLPATDTVDLYMRTSTNNGGAYDSGASDYSFITQSFTANLSETSGAEGDDAISEIMLYGAGAIEAGNSTNEQGNFIVDIMNPSGTTYTTVNFSGNFVEDTTSYMCNFWGSGRRISAADVDAIQFLFSSGNISTGTFRLYGLSAS